MPSSDFWLPSPKGGLLASEPIERAFWLLRSGFYFDIVKRG